MKKMSYQDDGLRFGDEAAGFGGDAVLLSRFDDRVALPAESGDYACQCGRPLFHDRVSPSSDDVIAAAPTTPTMTEEVSFLSGLNPNGTITSDSYWGSTGRTAFKFGDSAAGTGATITYSFKGFTSTEENTLLEAMALWSSVADITFVEAASQGSADILYKRGRDGSAYSSTPATRGQGDELGEVTGQAIISIDTSVLGFDLSGSFETVGGYGLSTAVHEIGHLLSLGHGGAYNGAVNPATQQYSAYDDRMYSIMSYIGYYDENAKFADQNPVQGTDWGVTDDGYLRQAPHTMMMLDILAVQAIYGVADSTPLDGGQTYGFNCNITGALGDFFDFTVNTDPVVTLYNQGLGNTLDCSGYNMAQTIDLNAGAFSDIAGHENNVCIAADTRIDTAIGGSGNDTIIANDFLGQLFGGGGNDDLFGGAGKDSLDGGTGGDSLSGSAGKDAMTGGAGADMFVFELATDSAKKNGRADTITDFSHAQNDKIDLSAIDARAGGGDNAFNFIGSAAFGNNAGELRFQVISGDTFVSGDIDGNGAADFTIRLDNVTTVVAADFVL